MHGMNFQSPKEDILTLSDVISRIKTFILEDQNSRYSLTIGSDSEIRVDTEHNERLILITAVVIYRKGYGGTYFWLKRTPKNPKTLRDKIYVEVLQSVEIAKILVPELRCSLNGNSDLYDLEIHIDVGEKGRTREMIKEVVGIVTGFGFTARTKPNSYAASNIADKLI